MREVDDLAELALRVADGLACLRFPPAAPASFKDGSWLRRLAQGSSAHQRVGQDAGDDLAHHKGDDQPQRNCQSALVGAGAYTVSAPAVCVIAQCGSMTIRMESTAVRTESTP